MEFDGVKVSIPEMVWTIYNSGTSGRFVVTNKQNWLQGEDRDLEEAVRNSL